MMIITTMILIMNIVVIIMMYLNYIAINEMETVASSLNSNYGNLT